MNKKDNTQTIRISVEVYKKLESYYLAKRVDGIRLTFRQLVDKAILNFLKNKK